MNTTFADSCYFLALFNSHDAAHDRALNASHSLHGELVTTEWILTEVADALCGAANRNACVAMINDVRLSSRVKVVGASRELFERGWQLYSQRPDKEWSLTDCISFEVMQDRRITTALAGDHHFEQAGFTAILR